MTKYICRRCAVQVTDIITPVLCVVCGTGEYFEQVATPVEAAREKLATFDPVVSGTTILGVKASANEKLSELTDILTTLIDAT